MSAIAAFLRFDGGPDAAESLNRMLDAMRHRGPDGRGVHIDAGAALGVLLLRTVPDSGEAPAPLKHEGSGSVLVVDGRVDNRDALIYDLRLTGDCTDEAILLAALERWGVKALAKAVGDYTFAWWDKRTRTLTCGRDVMGPRLLYYLHEPGKLLAVATEIKALLAVATSKPPPDERSIAKYLLGLRRDPSETALGNVHAVPPGAYLTFRDGRLTVRRIRALEVRPQRRSVDDAIEEFSHCFEEAVSCRLRAPHPLGFALSGGLDSSSIVGTARRSLPDPVRTYSFVFPTSVKSDERPFIEDMARFARLEPSYVDGDSLGPLTMLEQLAGTVDEPLNAPNLHLHWLLFQRAKEHGVRVFLDGLDGDTVVSHGGLRICELLLAGRFPTMLRELRMTAAHRGVSPGTVFRRVAFNPIRRTIRSRIPIPALRRASDTAAFLNRDFVRRACVEQLLLEASQRPLLNVASDQLYRLSSGGVVPNLETANHATAVLGMESRFPFQDVRLVELCLSLASDMKLRDGWDRWILRRSMAGALPESLQWRKGKSNLSHAYLWSFTHHDGAKAVNLLEEAVPRLAPYCDTGRLQEDLRSQLEHGSGDNGTINLWRALALSEWLRRWHE